MPDKLEGLIAATFTPLRADGELDVAAVPRLVDHLVRSGVRGMFVNGSTGEGELLTAAERQAVAEAYVRANAGRLPLIVQVGHNSVREACQHAAHAAAIGTDAISATAPSYFKPRSVDALVDWLAAIAEAAPDTPLYFYNIPGMTGVELDMVALLDRAGDRLPSLVGIKYSKLDIVEMPRCLAHTGGRYDILFGVDELLLTGLYAGCKGAVGTTYNFAAPIYNSVIEAFARGDLDTARQQQNRASRMVALQLGHGGLPAFKATMALLGLDCGPCRLPLPTLSAAERETLRAELEAVGFFSHVGATG